MSYPDLTNTSPTMSFVCEISGKSLSTLAVSTNDSIVVTPSGHLCRRSLLLAKLAENGGLDPFDASHGNSSSRPLREEDLVEVQQLRPSKSLDAPLVVPPRPQSGSISHTLQQLQQDYDAVVLELFDTRKILTETRQELALALYENDAAVRVVARLAAERDQAWSAVHTLKSTAAAQATPPAVTTAPPESQSNNEDDEPPAKKSKRSIESAPTKLPKEDWNLMVSAWEKLHENRKTRQKAASKRAVSMEQLTTLVATALPAPPPSTHPVLAETTGSKTALASSGWGAETATMDPCLVHSSQQYPHVLVYRPATGAANNVTWSLQTMNASSAALVGSALDVRDAMAALASINGSVDIVSVGAADTSNGTNLPLIVAKEAATTKGETIVDVRLHPDGVHVVAATSSGVVLVGRIDTAQVVARFEHSTKESGSSYSTGVLHPDGLIYIVAHAGTGDLFLWDFKSQSLADTILSSGLSSPVTSVDCSNTGYHIAAAYRSGAVLVWDLRKQQVLATINEPGAKDGDLLDAVVSVKFDDSGKFLAYSGNCRDGGGLSIGIVTVKEWNKRTMLTAPNFSATAGLIWGPTWIAVAASSKDDSGPRVLVFGLPST
jgi:pre-mRNA-processing factor 19